MTENTLCSHLITEIVLKELNLKKLVCLVVGPTEIKWVEYTSNYWFLKDESCQHKPSKMKRREYV